MINVKDFYETLTKNGTDFFCGVPDSLLKDFCAYIADNVPGERHIISANEGNAIAMAAGHYLATEKPALVYMQNSGLGNCINPLLSLTDEEVYKIPLLMLIGWRGEPGVKDEPQHIKQGKVTDKILEAVSIDYDILPKDLPEAEKVIEKAFKFIKENKRPYALIIKKDTFEKYKSENIKDNRYKLKREDAIKIAAQSLEENDIIVSTTGQISRELYEYREEKKQLHNKDFLTVGSMGHASSVALAIAIEKQNRSVYCFDGDGAFIMHMGALPVISQTGLKNFKHIIFNNEAHDSVGGQPTSANQLDFKNLAKSCGYEKVFSAKSRKELKNALKKLKEAQCTALLEIKVKCGARKDLGRPKEKPQENKKAFMYFLEENIAFTDTGSLSKLKTILEQKKAKSVLVFTGKSSYEKIKRQIQKQLRGIKFQTYNNFSINPKAQEAQEALKKLKGFDVIVAVGGGSVLDFAKLFRYCYDNQITPQDALKNKCQFSAAKKTPFIAIPTTAGTGAEATKFAVVYVNGKKYSFEHRDILPDYVILESSFLKDTPKYTKACCAADALCQAIESYWSVNSTKESKEYAKRAMELCRDYMEEFVTTDKAEPAQNMALAAFLSGRAINISKTTAAHALSYQITTDYSIPHGHAVSLSISKLMQINEEAKKVIDPRGENYVKETLKEIKEILKTGNPQKWFDNLFQSIGLEQDLKKLGIKNTDELAKSVNIQRLKNNPVELDFDTLKYILE